MKRTRPAKPATWETVQEISRALPGAVEGTSYGTPAFHVRKKLFVRLHQSGESIVIMIDLAEREALMTLDPETCLHHGALSQLPGDARAARDRAAPGAARTDRRLVAIPCSREPVAEYDDKG